MFVRPNLIRGIMQRGKVSRLLFWEGVIISHSLDVVESLLILVDFIQFESFVDKYADS